MFEILLYSFGLFLKHSQMSYRLLLKLITCPGWLSRMHSYFQITIEVFIRIQLRRVGWQKENFDLLFMLFQPIANNITVMDGKVVKNQENFAVTIPYEPFHKFNQGVGIHLVLVDHESNFSLVGYRRNQVDPLTSGRQPDSRCLAPRRKTSTVVAIIANPRLIPQ